MTKLSFHFKIFAYLFLVFFLTVVATATLTLYNSSAKKKIVEAGKILKSHDIDTEIFKIKQLEQSYESLNIIILSTGSFLALITLFVLINFRGRSLRSYNTIIDRLKVNPANFSLNINFPPEDMFGNLGSRLNKLITALQTFDRIKQQKYLLERVKTKTILEQLDSPVYILDERLEFDTYNEAFGDAFDIDPKTFDPGELEELVRHIRLRADIYSKSIRNETFKEKIGIKEIEFQVEFITIPILYSGEDKKLYCFIFIFNNVKRLGKMKK